MKIDLKRVAPLAAVLLAAGLLVVGCPNKKGETQLEGDTFPAVSGAVVSVLDLSEITNADGPFPELLSGQTDAVGAFGRFFLGNGADEIGLEIQGGTFNGFTLGGAVVVTSTIDVELRAIFPAGRGRKIEGITVTYLSHIATSMATGLRLYAGVDERAAINECNAAVSQYFDAGVGLDIPFTTGVRLWDTHGASVTGLTPASVVGLVSAGFLVRQAALGIPSIDTYLELVAADAADGVADGLVHTPFVGQVQRVTDLTGAPAAYPANALGDDLASDIETFLSSAANRSRLSSVSARLLLERLRASDGVVLSGVPLIDGITSPTVPGDREVTVTGESFQAGAQVYFGPTPATTSVVLSSTSLVAEAPASVQSGDQLFLTVINPSGKRHSQSATITLP